jgi:Cu+-exporting ATPase
MSHQAAKAGLRAKVVCYHCGTPVSGDPITFNELPFCCTGCKTVYQVLSKSGMCEYYNLNEAPGINQRMQVRPEKFAFLDDEAIGRQLIQYTDGNESQVTFYLPQVHCSSCLWLLEHLQQLDSGVVSSRVDFAHKEVTIRYLNSQVTLRGLATLLASIGYEPHISLNDLGKKPGRYYNKQRIYRLGVAGFCLGNIMLLSFPEYLGVAEAPEQLALTPWFRYLNLALALPVFFFSAQEFFVTGLKGLAKGFLNIDLPIALAILITFARSVYEVVSGTGGGYFDSMSGIVFFMLVGRLLQDKTRQSLTFDRDYTSYFPIAVNRIESEREVPVALPELRTGDRVMIHHNEIIPADGMLVNGHAAIDYSFVTGESVPVQKQISELIYAGGRQTGGKIELLLVKDVSQSYLTSLWNKASQHKDAGDDGSFIHPLARYFTAILFGLTAAAAAYWAFADPARVWPVVTAMLIVACPCALLLSSTFTNGHVVRQLDRAGMYLRNYGVLEKLLSITHIVFDKTGTITQNNAFEITAGGDALSDKERQDLAALAAQSHHPLSRALAEWLGGSSTVLPNFKETAGAGIEAWIDDRHYLLGSATFAWGHQPEARVKGSVLAWRIDHGKQGMFILRNNYRRGLAGELRKLAGHYQVAVVSGDNDAEKENLATIIGQNADLRFSQSPYDKLHYIESLQKNGARVLMIGDGLNDAAALQQSEVGIAVTDDINNFSPASDAILEAEQLAKLHRFLTLARRGRQIIVASFVISVLYNIIGLSFAVAGLLTPLVAAILMPASSISIILFTWLGVELYGWRLLR